MDRRAFLFRALAASGAGPLAAPAVRAQGAWPHGKPIRVVIPWPPGAANTPAPAVAAPSTNARLFIALLPLMPVARR